MSHMNDSNYKALLFTQISLLQQIINIKVVISGPMTPLFVIFQIFILLVRPNIIQPDQGKLFLDQSERAINISNTHIHSEVNASNLPLSVQSSNSTSNSSIGNLKATKLSCRPTTSIPLYDSCRQVFGLLPRNARGVIFGNFEHRDYVTHVAPYALTSCISLY